MRRVQWLVGGAVEARNAALAVDTRGVVLAIQADTSTLVHVVQVLAGVAPVHLGVIVTVVGMAMAVAGLALIGAVRGGGLPRLLVEAWTASVTRASTRVVLAGTLQPERIRGVLSVTDICVAMTDAAAADADVFDAVIIPAGDGGVPQRLAHKVAQERVGSQKPQADVGGLGEVSKYW